jgi:hypothetical protein
VLYSKPYSSPGCLSLHKNSFSARRWWLTPVILATQEAEIRRKMVVQSQPRQIVHETLSQKKNHHKKELVVAQGVDPDFKPQYCTQKKKFLLESRCLSFSPVGQPL